MPRPTARLSNCYVPLPLPSSVPAVRESPAEKLASLRSSRRGVGTPTQTAADHQNNGEDDPRNSHSLRRLCLETSVTGQLGSALVELGHTKVLCEVDLTTRDYPSSISSPKMDQGILHCQVQYAPNVGINVVGHLSQAVTPLESTISAGKLNSEIMTKEADLSFHLSSALLPSIPLERFPKCVLRVDVTILQDDGSVLSACIIAASMALADARVDLYDLVSSATVTVAVDNNNQEEATFLADPTRRELSISQAELCLAMLPNHKEVTLWNQSGRLRPSMSNQAMELCRDGCRTMHKFMREHLVASSKDL